MNYRFKGDIAVYVLIMLGMAIGLYLMGFSSVAFVTFDEFASDSGAINVYRVFEEVAKSIVSVFTDVETALPMGAFAFLTILIGSGNYSTGTILSFVIPVMIIYGLANFLFFPVVPIIEAEAHATPQMNTITLLLSIIFNVMLFLAILEYSSGRQ